MKNGSIEKFSTAKHVCDLCNARGVIWMCIGCKRVLCLNVDRSEKIKTLMSNDKERKRLLRDYPIMKDYARDDVPARIMQVGNAGGSTIYAGMSCFHFAHPEPYGSCQPCKEEKEAADIQMSMVASASASSPTR